MMKKLLKQALTLLLTVTMLLPVLASCDGEETTSTQSTETAPPTTAQEKLPTGQSAEQVKMLSENTYAQACLEQAELLIDKYYVKRMHKVKRSFTESQDSEIWYVGAFLDAMSEAYTLFPDNEKIKTAYLDCLDKCLPGYRVTNATIKPPSGKSYRGITYYNAGKGTSGDFYYDDNAWICISYLTAYEQFGTEEYLTRAKEIAEFLWTGYDDYQGGGIYWSSEFDNNGKSNKGTCTNGPSCISYLWLYKLTGESDYLEKGKLLFEWEVATLRTAGGIYHAGVGDPWQPAYDQGTMIYAASMLYEIEGTQRYLTLANKSYRSLPGHIFSVKGDDVSIERNRIYKSWCVGWLIRGINKYYTVDPKHQTDFMKKMEAVLDKTLKTKDENGQYDPFFCSSGTDFWDKDYYDNQVIMPAGMTSVMALAAYFDVFLRGSNEKL